MNFSKFALIALLYTSCLTTEETIKNKKSVEGTIVDQGYVYMQINYYINKTKYTDNFIILSGLSGGEIFELLIDSMRPWYSIILFYKPIIKDTSEYYSDSGVINQKNLQYYPIFRKQLFFVGYSFKPKENDKKILYRSEYVELTNKSNYLKTLHKGDRVPILINKNNPYKCYINLR